MEELIKAGREGVGPSDWISACVKGDRARTAVL